MREEGRAERGEGRGVIVAQSPLARARIRVRIRIRFSPSVYGDDANGLI
jgi:hypothetical protein